MFLGNSFAGSSSGIANMSVTNPVISNIKIKDVIVDELYATSNVLLKFDWQIPQDWALDTHLHATYEKNLHAGNVEYSTEVVTSVKIKKRFLGDFEWKTIYEQPVNTNDDFKIEFYDYYEPTGRIVEYAYILVVGGSDVESAISSVESKFYSYFICGPEGESYPMIVNLDNTITYNRKSNVIVSPGRKYPYVNNNGIAQYYSGRLNVSFIAMDGNCDLDMENAWKYRNEIDQFLANGESKILKSFEGDIWMVHVVNDIPRNNSGHYQLVDHQIEWVEAGSPFSIGDLYDNNFINTDIDRD